LCCRRDRCPTLFHSWRGQGCRRRLRRIRRRCSGSPPRPYPGLAIVALRVGRRYDDTANQECQRDSSQPRLDNAHVTFLSLYKIRTSQIVGRFVDDDSQVELRFGIAAPLWYLSIWPPPASCADDHQTPGHAMRFCISHCGTRRIDPPASRGLRRPTANSAMRVC
jgi:hypothetical protein